MCVYRRMLKMLWQIKCLKYVTTRMIIEEVLRRINKNRESLVTPKRRKSAYIMRTQNIQIRILHLVIEGKWSKEDVDT